MTDAPLHIVHTEASAGWGGQEIRILSEGTGLRDRGHRVQLLTPSHAPILQAAHDLGLEASALPIGKKRLPPLRAMRRWLKQNPDVDVINTHSSTDSWLAAVACQTIANPPVIVRTRHISPPVSTNASTRWMYTKATAHIVTTGEKLRETLMRDNGFPGEMMTSIPTGQDTERYLPAADTEAKKAQRTAFGLPVDTPIVGILATLRDWKGHIELITALARLKRPDLTLLVVGDGPYRPSIEKAIAEQGMTGQVRLVGNQEDVTPWLQVMDLFVLPSWANEGVPQSILQAMLCRLPVISTPIGSIEEAVLHNETGIIVPPRDIDSLSAQIAHLLDNPQQADQFAQAGRERALTEFSRETMLDKMEAVFRNAVTQHRS